MKRRKFIGSMALTAGAFAFSGLGAKTSSDPGTEIKSPEQLKETLLAEAKRIFALNLVNSKLGRFHLPSNSSYPRFFGWDSGWNVIAQSAFDPEGARLELDTVFNSFQDDSGLVAHEALIPEFDRSKDPTYLWLGDKYFDARGRCRIMDPPSYLVGAEILYQKTKDPRILALLPKMEKCLEYLLGPRDLFGDGLVSIIHPWEAGTDLTPAFDQALGLKINNPFVFARIGGKLQQIITDCYADGWDLKKIAERNEFVFEDLCLNGLTAAGAVSVSHLFQAAGQKDQAGKWMSRAKSMAEAMEKICWDNERGFFFPRWDLKRKKMAKRVSVPGMMPLLCGLVSEDKAQRVIENYLLSPKQFWGPWPVPFNSIAEMKAENTAFVRGMLWRGPCIWINMNWIAARLAAEYGRKDLARAITVKTAEMIGRSGFREYYHPETGKGQGAVNFTWPALALEMIQEYGLG